MSIPALRSVLFFQLLLPLAAAQAQSLPVVTQGPAVASLVAPSGQLPAPESRAPFGMTDNMELIYKVLDEDGKPDGEIRQRVVTLASQEREESKDRKIPEYTATLKSGRYTKKNALAHLQDLTFRSRRDTCFTDGLADLDTDALRSFRDRKLIYSPIPLAWPNQPNVGSTLPLGGVKVQVSSSVVSIATISTIINRRRVVSGPAPLATPAGTFACYKVESFRESATVPRPDMAMRTTVKQVDFYSPGVGVVRTEIYNKKGKIAQVRELVSRTASR